MPAPDFPADTEDAKKLSDADQARVDAFLERGVNSVERKPFKPLFLIFLLLAVVAAHAIGQATRAASAAHLLDLRSPLPPSLPLPSTP